MPTWNPQANDIFLDALEIAAPTDRKAFIERACGSDAEMRAQVDSLMAASQKAGSFLENPPSAVAVDVGITIDHAPLEQPGTQIGPYKLLEQIGEGGMGIVYVASQKEPLRRKVALKIIKPGMDTREVVARFEAERQALALMDHPNIAKVFEAGATDAGRPYFAMELVKGTPITEYCDRQQLSTRERLALFVTLCHGVQHAHQKGVIHRDLKPSNLLVEVHDVRPVPKIIDFGIAKAVGQQLTEKTFYTAFDQMVGTPLYMSPEQAGQSAVDVDTRSDIYSLGVLLYELLTGYTPFEKDTLRTAGFDEMRRIIREVEPPRPSARVSTLQAADLSTVCDRRHVEPHKLSQELRGELDWIVMKAMDKDRDRRYVTVNDLAADVERYLHDEPVQACPPSVAYRFSKFARRYRTALVTSALIALALIAGTGVSIWQAIRATNAELVAIAERDEKEQQTLRAKSAELAAVAERDANRQLALRATNAEQQTAKALRMAQERLQFGRQAVDDMYTQFAEKWLAQRAELTLVQKQFLEKALAFYQQLATEESADPAVVFETAKAQQRVGEIQNKLGKHAEAYTAYRRAIELFAQLASGTQDAAKYNQALARAHDRLGRLLLFTGWAPEARWYHEQAVALHKALVDQFPGDDQYQRDLAHSYDGLGLLNQGVAQYFEAGANYRQSEALFQSLLNRSPSDRDLQFALANSQSRIAVITDDLPPFDSEPMLQSVVASATALVADDPKNPEYLEVLSRAHRSLGQRLTICLFKPKHWLESEASLRKALTIDEGLARDYPQLPIYRANLAATLDALGRVLDATGKPAEVEQIQQRSLEIGQKLAAEYPKVPDYQSALGVMANSRAAVQMGLGKWEEARRLLEQAITHQKAALAIIARHHQHITFLFAHWIDLIEVQIALGDRAAAERTAEDFAHHLYRPGALQSPFWAIDICEIFLVNMDVIQRPDAPYPQRREPQLAAYRLLIKALVMDAAERAQDDPDQYQIADFLTTAPEPFRDPALALKLARRAVELKPESDLCRQSLGWALYRAGDFKGSIEATKNLSAADANGSFVPAMAHWQLGEKTEAQARFHAATEHLKGYELKCQELLKTLNLAVPPPLQLRRLQAEAAALLGMTLPTAEPVPEPTAKVEDAKETPKSTPEPEAAKEEEPPK